MRARSEPRRVGPLVAARTERPVAVHVTVARTLRARLLGLLGRRALPDGEALVIPGCSSIHTIGMRFPIDAMFVDRSWRVVTLRAGIRPGRIVLPVLGAWGVVEVPVGTLERVGLRVGDQLRLLMS